MNNYIVYEHINLHNNKRYIGITKQNPIKRWNNGKGYQQNKIFFEDILLYGWKEGFAHNILYEGLTESEALQKENELIEKYDTTNKDKGYNKNKGGNTGPGEEWKPAKKFGEDNPTSKKVQCIETGDVFGSAAEANRWANTTKVQMVCRGERRHAGVHPETGQLLSWKYVPQDTKVTIICHESQYERKQYVKKIICINTGEVFDSASEAGRFYNITPCNILRVCHGQRQSAGKLPGTKEKLKWSFYEKI